MGFALDKTEQMHSRVAEFQGVRLCLHLLQLKNLMKLWMVLLMPYQYIWFAEVCDNITRVSAAVFDGVIKLLDNKFRREVDGWPKPFPMVESQQLTFPADEQQNSVLYNPRGLQGTTLQ